jgi:beta-lactamase superfamily II metal-dependent hydrolase
LGMEYDAAAALDGSLNGTSLMILFQVGKAWLLFPGDAQWGTWQLALNNPDSRRLLGTVNFYKVGHHASHNATPKEFVKDILKDDFYAMISTNHVDSWPQVPKKELVEALSLKTKKLVESDKPLEISNDWFTVVKKGVIEAHIPI